jgi:hypothetical protein
MRKLGVGLVVLVVAVAGLGFYLVKAADARFRAGLDHALGFLPPGYTGSYKTAHYDLLSSTGTVTGLTVHFPGATDQGMTADEVDIVHPPFRFGEVPTPITPETVMPVAGTLVMKHVVTHIAVGTVTLSATRIDNLRFYPWPLMHPGAPPLSAMLAQLGVPPDPTMTLQETLGRLKASIQAESAIAGSFGFDGEEVDSMAATIAMPATPQMVETTIVYSIDKAVGGRTDFGRFASSEADGLKIDSPLVHLDVRKLSFTDVNFRPFLTKAIAGAPLDPHTFDGVSLGALDYDGLVITGPKTPPITLDSVALRNLVFDHGMMMSGSFSLAGLKLDKAEMPAPQAAQAFDLLGLQTMTVSAGADYHWDAARQQADLNAVRLKVDELGALDLSTTLDIAKGGTWATDAGFTHATLHYVDASLADRALKAFAAQHNVPVEAMRGQLVQMMQQRGAIAQFESPAVANAWTAAATFVSQPRSLTVDLAPPAFVSFTTLRSVAAMPPPQLAALLGLSVTANGPAVAAK